MSRLTIDLSDQRRQNLRALAALQGKTIKQYASALGRQAQAMSDDVTAPAHAECPRRKVEIARDAAPIP